MKKIEYETTFARRSRMDAARRMLRKTALIIAVAVALWCGVAVARVWLTHVVLGFRIARGTANANADARTLDRTLIWSQSLRPLLKRPWKAVVLYYPNGYASSRSVKIH